MNEEADRRIEELRKEKRGALTRHTILILSGCLNAILALVLFFALNQDRAATSVYIQEAQQTVRVACDAADQAKLKEGTQERCRAAQRNELPQQLQSVVAGPPGGTGGGGARGGRKGKRAIGGTRETLGRRDPLAGMAYLACWVQLVTRALPGLLAKTARTEPQE